MDTLINISPSYRVGEVDLSKLDDRIKVYEDQIRGWLLGPAKALLSMPHSGFAVLHILMAYFEHHAIYRLGASSDRKSKQFFRQGFVAVFPKAAETDAPGVKPEEVSEWLADIMYSDARCGLFHEWIARRGIAITDEPKLMRAQGSIGKISQVTINVNRFFAMIEKHFSDYVNELKNPINAPMRAAFNAGWEATH